MPQISKKVRDAAWLLLADATNGINPKLAALAGTYGIDIISFDFSASSLNVIQGSVLADDVEQTSEYVSPYLIIRSLSSTDYTGTARVKSLIFSGEVVMQFEYILEFPTSAVTPDSESLGDAIEDVMYQTLQSIPGQQFLNAHGGVLFPGAMNLQRQQVIQGGENWRQSIIFTATFNLNTN